MTTETPHAPNAEDREWVMRQFETAAQAKPPRSSAFKLTPRSVLEACGELFAEQRREIAALRERLDQLERGSVKPKLVAPSSSGSMIA
jgi:hypothetical protein